MDEARFVFEFTDRSGSGRAPGGSAPNPSGGQGSDTAGKYWDSQNQAGGAGGLAFENSQKFGRNHPGVSTPASVPQSPAAKPSDTSNKSLSDTFTEISGIVGQAAGAVRGLPSGPADLLNRGKAIADAANRALSLGDKLFPGAPPKATEVPPIDARVRAIDVMSPTDKAKSVAADVFKTARDSAAKRAKDAAGDVDPADAARAAAKEFGRGVSKSKTVVAEVVEDAAAVGRATNATGTAVRVAGGAATAGRAAGGAASAAGVGGGAASAGGLGAASLAGIGGVAALAAIPTLAYVASLRAANTRMGEIAAGQAGQFSGDVASALARAEVRQIRADLRTAERVGGIVADNVTQNSRLAESGQRIKDAFVEAFGPDVNSIMRFAADISTGIAYAAEQAAEVKRIVDEYFPKATSLLDKIRQEQEKQESMTFFDWFAAQPHITPDGMNFNENVNIPGARFDAPAPVAPGF